MSLIKQLIESHEFDSTSLSDDVKQLVNYAYNLIGDGEAQGFNDEEEAEYFVDTQLSRRLDWLYKESPFSIYRVISIEDKNNINYDSLGDHYTKYRKNLYEHHFYNSIQLNLNNDNIYVGFEVQVKFEDIDWETTIENILRYPQEDEINLNSNAKPIIKDKFIIRREEIK